MKYFKNDRRVQISGESPVNIGLNEILEEFDQFPTNDEFEGGFIGIINDKDETINFIRFEKNSWFLDFPILKNGVYSHSLQNEDITTKKVKKIITVFFKDEDWKTELDLDSSKKEQLADKTKRRFETFKEVGDEGAVLMERGVLTKQEFIKKLEDFPCSTNDMSYGIFAELSKPFVMIKNSDGKWEVRLDFENPTMDVKIYENEKDLDFEKILDIKKWVNDQF